MAMAIGGYYANPYIPVPSYAANARGAAGRNGGQPQDDGANIIDETEAAQQMAQTMNPSAVTQVQREKNEPQGIGAIEAEPESQQMRHDSMDRRFSGAQMDMLDIQAAFFGFSARRTTDIPRVTMEEALRGATARDEAQIA